jgi:diguanylate cyclase (GGDEF)-like protein/PAS domain S-box-containing protein
MSPPDTSPSVEGRFSRIAEELRASEERYRVMVETAAEGVWALDAADVTTFANERMAAILGCRPDDLVGRSVFDFVAGAVERTLAVETLDRRRRGVTEQFDCQLVRADGVEVWTLMSASPMFDSEGRYAGSLAMVTDITARKRAEDELRQSQRQLAAAQRLSATGSWDRDLRGGVLRWSDEFIRILGLEPGTPPSLEALLAALHPDDRDEIARIRERATANGRDTVELRVVRPDGTMRTLQCVVEVERDDEGRPTLLTATAQDVTERKELEETLKRQALHDTLTGLPNRILFLDRVDHALRRRERTGEEIAVLFIDVDDFKTVNDSLGHTAGDEILLALGQRLVATLRPSDTVARLGGDEFAVLLEAADQPAAESATARILAALERPVASTEHEIVVGASVGIAVAAADAVPEDLLRDADAAMYAAKGHGGENRYRVFEPSMRAAARRRLELRAQLQTAVEEDQFEVFYQPVVQLSNGAVVGVEALVRWVHPELGLVSPAQFIPLAEETGLIVPIGGHVLRTATAWIQRLNESRPDSPLDLSVNLSARQLLESDFVQTVDDALQASGLPPTRLVLELTETVLVQEEHAVTPVLSQIRDRGVRIAADDFGTGYSSLSYLRRLPIDVLKIDRAFVTGIAHSTEDRAVAEVVVRLAEVLGLTTVGEGVETQAQAEALRDIGCTYGQGYLFSRPMPARELEQSLRSRG